MNQNLKKIIRITAVHRSLCFLLSLYVRFVYLTSKKTIKGSEKVKKYIKKGHGIILASWHCKILISPLVTKECAKGIKKARFGTLASKHKDGQFASKTLKLFGFKEILGSSIDKKKGSSKNKGGLGAIRSLIKELRGGRIFCITPDGPRGPAKQCNGEIINIGKLSDAPIFPVAINCSKYKELDTWDKFQVFLPFSKINIEFGDPIYTEYKQEKDIKVLNKLLKKKIDTVLSNNDCFKR